MRAVDLFAGPGGWDIAARDLGINVVGIEIDDSACDTREAAGLATIRGDVRAYSARQFPFGGLIGSPPCPTLSVAGKGSGRRAMDPIIEAARQTAIGGAVTGLSAGEVAA